MVSQAGVPIPILEKPGWSRVNPQALAEGDDRVDRIVALRSLHRLHPTEQEVVPSLGGVLRAPDCLHLGFGLRAHYGIQEDVHRYVRDLRKLGLEFLAVVTVRIGEYRDLAPTGSTRGFDRMIKG